MPETFFRLFSFVLFALLVLLVGDTGCGEVGSCLGLCTVVPAGGWLSG